jgi:predicted DNA-binding transcriptional regulator AlpA
LTPDLVSAREAAGLLGVSASRVRQLARDRPDFPKPYLSGGRGQAAYWRRGEIERWRDSADRRPGRRWPA